MTRPLLAVDHLTVSYASGLFAHKTIVLKNISLRVMPGEIVVLLGANGTGKSTLLKAICSLIPLDAGSVTINKKNLGYVPEKNTVPHFLTANKFLTHMGRLFALPHDQLCKRIAYLLKLVNLTEHKHATIGSFSKGMLQRLLLAQALINDPEILILDEPFSGLDNHSLATIKTILDNRRAHNKSVLLTTHSNVHHLGDRALELKDGKLHSTDYQEKIKSRSS